MKWKEWKTIDIIYRYFIDISLILYQRTDDIPFAKQMEMATGVFLTVA